MAGNNLSRVSIPMTEVEYGPNADNSNDPTIEPLIVGGIKFSTPEADIKKARTLYAELNANQSFTGHVLSTDERYQHALQIVAIMNHHGKEKGCMLGDLDSYYLSADVNPEVVCPWAFAMRNSHASKIAGKIFSVVKDAQVEGAYKALDAINSDSTYQQQRAHLKLAGEILISLGTSPDSGGLSADRILTVAEAKQTLLTQYPRNSAIPQAPGK